MDKNGNEILLFYIWPNRPRISRAPIHSNTSPGTTSSILWTAAVSINNRPTVWGAGASWRWRQWTQRHTREAGTCWGVGVRSFIVLITWVRGVVVHAVIVVRHFSVRSFFTALLMTNKINKNNSLQLLPWLSSP